MAHFLVEAPSSGQPLQASESCGLESISTYVMSSESAEMRDRRTECTAAEGLRVGSISGQGIDRRRTKWTPFLAWQSTADGR